MTTASLYLPAAGQTVTGDDGETTYTIDELAAYTKVPSRTIRFYQARGILDRPKRVGRKAVYTGDHVARLELIARLQDRGMRLRGMKQLLARKDSDAAVSHWLGLSEKLTEPWSEDRATVVDAAELERLIGDRPDGTLASLVDVGLVERRDDAPGSYFLRSQGLLEVALKLLDAGLMARDLAAIEPMLRAGLRSAAADIVEHLSTHTDLAQDDASLSAALDALRTEGANAVSIIFAQEIEQTLRGLLEAGGGKAAGRVRRQARRARRKSRRDDS